MKIALYVTTPDDFLGATVVERHFGEQAGNVETQLFALAEDRVEENIAEFADRASRQLVVALLNIGQVAQRARNLNQYHGLAVGAAVEVENFGDSEGQKRDHPVVD